MIEGQVHNLQEGQGTAFLFEPEKTATHYATYLAKQGEEKKKQKEAREKELSSTLKDLNAANVYLADRNEYAGLVQELARDAAKMIREGKDPFSGTDEQSMAMLERKMDVMNLAQISQDRAKIAANFENIQKTKSLGEFEPNSVAKMQGFLRSGLKDQRGKDIEVPELKLKDPLKHYTGTLTDLLGQIQKTIGEVNDQSIEQFVDLYMETAQQASDGTWQGILGKFDQLPGEAIDNLESQAGGKRQAIAQMIIDDLTQMRKPAPPFDVYSIFDDIEKRAIGGASQFDSPEGGGMKGQFQRFDTFTKEEWERVKNNPVRLRQMQDQYKTKDTGELKKIYDQIAKERRAVLKQQWTRKGEKASDPVKRKDWITKVQSGNSEALAYIKNSTIFGHKVESAQIDAEGKMVINLIKLTTGGQQQELNIPGLTTGTSPNSEVRQLNDMTYQVKVDPINQQSFLHNIYNEVYKNVKREWDSDLSTQRDQFLNPTPSRNNYD
jgi:uncharacterized protein YjbJ (UPF0337 family)